MYKVIDVEPGQCRGGVRPWLPTGKVWRGDDSFYGLCVRSDGRISSSGRRSSTPAADRPTSRPATESWHHWQGDQWAKMGKHTSMDFMRTTFKLTPPHNPCGQSQSSVAWYWPSCHCEWSDISMTIDCSSFISGRRDVLSYQGPRFHFPRGMFSEMDVRFASSSHALCSCHVDPPALLHLADSSHMHGRNVALVAAMNTPTFCNVNYAQKKWVLNTMTDELTINVIKSPVI